MTSDKAGRHAIGVDFGGTSVKLGLVDGRGRLLARRKFPTGDVRDQSRWLDAISRAASDMAAECGLAKSELSGIGVGVPGFVDFERGFIHDLTNVPGWTSVELGTLLSKHAGLRAVIDNDVNAMALGECMFGAGRGFRHAVFVTLGTGVGGGILIDGRIHRGAFSMAGEIGHVSIDMHGIKAPQGVGGVEQYVGNARIAERARQLLEEGRVSAIEGLCQGDRSAITPELIQQAAEQGDALALEIYDFVADCLATAFASVTYILQPQAIIIGGGVAKAGAVLFDPIRRHLAERLSPYFFQRLEIHPAALGSDAGLIGCASLVLF